MGRMKRYHERMIAAFPKGTFKEIKKVLEKHEDRTDFVRAWVMYGIKARKMFNAGVDKEYMPAHGEGQPL